MNRTLICTFSTLLSGCLGGYIGGQITLTLHSQTCENQPWGVKEMCSVWVTSGALWQGSTTGLWTGGVLGAYFAGLATRKLKIKS